MYSFYLYINKYIYIELFLCTKFLPSSKAYPHDSSKRCQCQYHICIPAVVCALVFPATRLLKFSQLVPLPLHAQNIEICFKTHPISPTFSQLSTNHEAFLGDHQIYSLPDCMPQTDSTESGWRILFQDQLLTGRNERRRNASQQ